ncbi:MAG: adenylate/guanylate cyclase domain-containing protein [Nitrospirae bacterium]|nr:adenylate/guanylate cyclase domain-containing protein [Nitrospirota bacterium]
MAERKNLPVDILTIMYTDMVRSTAIADFLRGEHGNDTGDNIYAERVRGPHDAIVRLWLAVYNGYEVKTIGDSFMAVFKQPNDAIRAATCIIIDLADSNIKNPADHDRPLQLRIGFHLGIVRPEEVDGIVKDYSGHNVNLAARVESLAVGSQILFSGAVKEIVDSLPGFEFHSWGKRKLKGIKGPVEIL